MKIDLEQHRDYHQPDQRGHRQVYLSYLHLRQCLKAMREDLAQRDTDTNTQKHPDTEIVFEKTYLFFFFRLPGNNFELNIHDHR